MLRLGLIIIFLILGSATLAGSDETILFESGEHRLTVPISDLHDVYLTKDYSGNTAIHARFSKKHAADFGNLTTKIVGKELSIIVCGQEVVRPTVMSPLFGGTFLITGAPDFIAKLEPILRGEMRCAELMSFNSRFSRFKI